RKAYERRAISFGGDCASSTDTSSTIVHSRTACSKAGASKLPSSRRNAIRLREARLHAVSSKKLYSEHGFEALIRPLAGQVCQSFIVVSNCSPGSAEAQAAWPIRSHSSRARSRLATFPPVRRVNSQMPLLWTRSRKSSDTRTELFEFCPATVR